MRGIEGIGERRAVMPVEWDRSYGDGQVGVGVWSGGGSEIEVVTKAIVMVANKENHRCKVKESPESQVDCISFEVEVRSVAAVVRNLLCVFTARRARRGLGRGLLASA